MGGRNASFSARWRVGKVVPDPAGSLEHFLVERYALYSVARRRLVRVRVRHRPWVLRSAEIEQLDQTVSDAHGITFADPQPLAHFSDGVTAEFFPPEVLGGSTQG